MRAPSLRPVRATVTVVLFLSWSAAAHAGTLAVRLAERAVREGSVRVLVELDQSIVPEGLLPDRAAVAAQRAGIAARGRRLARILGGGGRLVRTFDTIPWVAAEVDPAGLAALEQSADVRAVTEDEISRPLLDQSVPLIGADVVQLSGYDGAGGTIAILDTGIDADHPFLGGRVVSEACFSTGGDCPNGGSTQLGPGAGAPCTYAPGGCAHGTHVAGIAIGSNTSRTGVAPGADLISIQIFSRFDGSFCGGSSPCAASFTSDQIKALERVLTLADTFSIGAVNMSIGGTVTFSSTEACDAANGPRKSIIDHLRSIGIATVVAAGNEGSTAGLTSPACISSVLSVGASTKDDQVAGFSNSADDLSLLAPGVGITSAKVGGGFAVMSGTSMAAPHVAGTIALLRQQSSSATVTELLERLRSTGVPLLDPKSGVETPRVSALAAFAESSTGTRGLLEFPLDGSHASGIGTFTGWLCDADSVLIRVDGGPPMVAVYGTARNDTQAVCGDTDNAVSLLYNFNRDGDGEHVAELIADGVVVSSSRYTVTTFGVPFLSDAANAAYILPNFEGHDVTVRWLTERQGFEIVGVD